MSDFDLSSINSVSDVFPRPKRKAVRKGKKVKRVPPKNKTEWGWITPDGREICDTRKEAGKREYAMRTHAMCVRQGGVCKCGRKIAVVLAEWMIGYVRATFGHDIPRGNGGMNRDDRIWDSEGKPMNHAECWDCNSEKGSKRI
jgi:hypothetical protein